MEDLEGNRKQKLLDTRKRQFTCGWTSEELGWQREERRRQWGGTTEIGLRNWLVDRYRKENSNQSLAEGSLKRYLRELNLAADLTPNLDGCLYSGDAIQVRGSGGLLLAALPRDVDERGKYLSPCRATATADARTLRRTSFRVLRNDARLPSSVPLLYEECILLSTPETTGGFLLKSEPRRYSVTGRQEVTWSQECTGSCLWKILPKPLPCTSQYVAVNDDLVLSHVITNQNLALQQDFPIQTMLGREYEVAACSGASHISRSVGQENIWQLRAPFQDSS